MSKILELREKRAKAWETANAFLDAKRGADGLLAAEDVATYEKMEADVVNLGKEIDRLERQAALDAELSKPVNTPLTASLRPLPVRKRLAAPLRNTAVLSGTPCAARCLPTRL